jgi:hypothetical protein
MAPGSRDHGLVALLMVAVSGLGSPPALFRSAHQVVRGFGDRLAFSVGRQERSLVL